MPRAGAAAFVLALIAAFARSHPAAAFDEAARPLYTYREVMVPMRDGVKLQTVIMVPLNATGPLPILLRRTPYGVPDAPYRKAPEALSYLAADGYILVVQNLRGRFKSEGVFSIADDMKVTPGQGTPETRDGWDTVEWLSRHVPESNGRVGAYGVSYDGYTAAAMLLKPHPALKAVSEQASPADEWMNDDFHRYGALRLSYAFEYSVEEETDKFANTHFAFDTWDTYDWYLRLGALSNANQRYLKSRVPFWNNVVAHPDYDAFWKSQAWVETLHSATVPNLNVAGFWDQEDPWGPWTIFRHSAQDDPRKWNVIVAGPWQHGGWRKSVSTLGPIPLGEDTAKSFRRDIEAPFFAHWLHDIGGQPAWSARIFQTGTNVWKSYPAWPPAAQTKSLYLSADGSLDFSPPTPNAKGAYREYVSDLANPIPYRPRPMSPTYPAGDWPLWESGDQRFVDHRPDVLTYVSAPLAAPLEIAGPLTAQIYASTSGSDCDLVVKVIDVFPEEAAKPTWSSDTGPAPGQYVQSQNGYELPIAMEVRRGRYLTSPEKPRALSPNVPIKWDIPLRDRDHVFLPGHRIMVQLQSSWFPLIDLNTATGKSRSTNTSRQRVYSSPRRASHIDLPVVETHPPGTVPSPG